MTTRTMALMWNSKSLTGGLFFCQIYNYTIESDMNLQVHSHSSAATVY